MTPWHFTMLGYKAGFAQPAVLLALVAVVLFGLLAVILAMRRTSRLRNAVPLRHALTLTPGVSVLRPVLQSSAYTLALCFFVVALAQPQCGERAEVSKRRGIDVVVALDASKSMYTRDVTPSRLERAKLELTSLLDSLKGDRVAIIAFAGDAFIQCPLTADYSAAKLFLRAVEPESMPQGGTNIGAALLLARQVLENADRGAKDKVVVLLSDGEDLSQDVQQGIDALKEMGARVLAIGIGSETGEPIPVLNKAGEMTGYQKDENGVTVISRLDRAGLTHVASATGGQFFFQPRGVAMNEVVDVIDSLQKTEQESRITIKYGEVFQPYVAIGLFWLAVGFLILPSWRKRISMMALMLALSWSTSAQAAGPLERNHPDVDEGTTAYEAQRYEDALIHYQRAAQERPKEARAHYNLGLALHKLGRNEEAQNAFQTALDLDSRHELGAKIHYNMGNVAAAGGDEKRALREYRAALTQNPSDEQARHNLEVLLKKIPPKPPPTPDAGTPDGGNSDGGNADAGRPDAGANDAGKPDAGADGGRSDGGEQSDAGQQDGGRGDGGSQGDAGSSDGGAADGGGKPEKRDGGTDSTDGGAPEPQRPNVLPDGGVDVSQREAEQLLDSLKNSEKNFQLWRFKPKNNKRNEPHGKDW